MSDPDAQPQPWIDAFLRSYYEHHPVHATFIGVHRYDARLPDPSESGLGDLLATAQTLLSDTATQGRVTELTAETGASTRFNRIDERLARGFLRIRSWELQSEHFERGNPSHHTGEAVFGILGLFLSDYAPLAERAESAIDRMHQVTPYLETARASVQAAPSEWTARAIRECDGALAFFTEGVEHLATKLSGNVSAFRTAAGRAARAFSDHRAWLEHDLLTKPHERYAAGPEALALHIHDGHCLPDEADEIARYAEACLAEAEARLSDGLPTNLSAAQGHVPPDEALQVLHPSAEHYYPRYQELWDDVRHLAEEKRLVTWPDFPIRYVPRPEWCRAAAPFLYFLFYRSPAAFGRPAVHNYLVAPLPEGDRADFLRANNDSVIKLNHVIHHGGLGHHVQNWHAFRSESRIGQIAAVDCAARTAMHCGGTMAEGWACYATDLASEAGALTPLEQYAELKGRARMAARAVVDVRLHQGRMSLNEAAVFYQQRAGMSPRAARGEAVKNSMFPGGALMYLMGTDAIHDLRSEMVRILGADFDLCSFHDEFLSYGSIPVAVIAEEMRADHAQ